MGTQRDNMKIVTIIFQVCIPLHNLEIIFYCLLFVPIVRISTESADDSILRANMSLQGFS